MKISTHPSFEIERTSVATVKLFADRDKAKPQRLFGNQQKFNLQRGLMSRKCDYVGEAQRTNRENNSE